MWTEDETILISAIEHWSYCPRQCALIHIEQVFDENVFTLRGSRAHERTDTATWEMQGTTRIERALPLWSEQYGLTGRADTVEFHADGAIYPVEYKHGPRREHQHDDLQLCAQAVCLEEIFGQRVMLGAIYHHSTRRRREVAITGGLRDTMAEVLTQIRHARRTGIMPLPVHDGRCPSCSLIDACAPAALSAGRLAHYGRQLYTIELNAIEPAPTSRKNGRQGKETP